MRRLRPRIHLNQIIQKKVDGRVKPGHDGGETGNGRVYLHSCPARSSACDRPLSE